MPPITPKVKYKIGRFGAKIDNVNPMHAIIVPAIVTARHPY